MKVKDLIKILGECNPNAVISINEYEITGYVNFGKNGDKVGLIYIIPRKEKNV